MEFTTHRRIGGAKYGKSANKVVVHDFFGWDGHTDKSNATTTKYLISPASSNTESSAHEDTITVQPVSSSVRPPHVVSHSPSPPPTVRKISVSTPQNEHSMYDIDSSDGDRDRVKVIKRRKLESKQPAQPKPGQKVERDSQERPASARLEEQTLAKRTSEKVKTAARPGSKVPAVAAKAPVEQHSANPTKKRPQPAEDQAHKALPTRKSVPTTAGSALPLDNSAPVSLPPGVPSSDNTTATAISGKSNHKKARAIHPETIASPARVRLADLQLSQPSPVVSRTTRLMQKVPPISAPARKGRRRLMDGLDAPSDLVAADDDSQSSATPSEEEVRTDKKLIVQPIPNPVVNRPALARSESSQVRRTYSKYKNTYAKERSHLTEMVDDVDSMSDISSQDAGQQLVAQLTKQSQPSQLQMELELDDDSNDDALPGAKLKSIHELRTAGTTTRFDRELETLLEDVDPDNKSNSKSLRIQALMKLIRKAAQPSFLGVLSSNATDRLVKWTRQNLDDVSLHLLHIALWQIACHDQLSTTRLKSIFDALDLTAPRHLSNSSAFAEVAKDRKQNLSKATCRDLLVFERDVLADNLLPGLQGQHLYPATILLSAMKDTLQALVDVGEIQVQPSQTCVRAVVRILSLSIEPKSGLVSSSEDPSLLRTVLSFLQLCTGALHSSLELDENEYKDLGSTLASIVEHTHEESLIQGVLHFTISLSNDRPKLCEFISRSHLSTCVMAVVQARFHNLLRQADNGLDIDQTMLDTVILSFACLLNLTEHATTTANGSPSVEKSLDIAQLVSLYNHSAPKLVGAQTEEKSQLLVAFGYLSLLICSLSRSKAIKSKVSSLLENKDMDDVIASATELLLHLRTVESQTANGIDNDDDDDKVNVEEGALDGFTQRFGEILVAVRQ